MNIKNNMVDTVGIYGEQMLDIYPEKNYFLLVFYLSVFLVLLGILFKLFPLNFSFTGGKKLQKKKEKINYSKLLNDIERNYLKEKKTIFYGNLADFFRIFLDNRIELGLSKKSFAEIQNNLKDKKIINLYERIYFPEYDKTIDSEIKRIELIYEVKNLINKYK